jgi:hypothetical protein
VNWVESEAESCMLLLQCEYAVGYIRVPVCLVASPSQLGISSHLVSADGIIVVAFIVTYWCVSSLCCVASCLIANGCQSDSSEFLRCPPCSFFYLAAVLCVS